MLDMRESEADEEEERALNRESAFCLSFSSGRDGRVRSLFELRIELERADRDLLERLDLAESDFERSTGRGVWFIMVVISGLPAPSLSELRPRTDSPMDEESRPNVLMDERDERNPRRAGAGGKGFLRLWLSVRWMAFALEPGAEFGTCSEGAWEGLEAGNEYEEGGGLLVTVGVNGN